MDITPSRDKTVREQQLHLCYSCWRLGESSTRSRVLLSVLVLQSLLLTCSSELLSVLIIREWRSVQCSYVWVWLLVHSAVGLYFFIPLYIINICMFKSIEGAMRTCIIFISQLQPDSCIVCVCMKIQWDCLLRPIPILSQWNRPNAGHISLHTSVGAA